jgi:hypothetical protein
MSDCNLNCEIENNNIISEKTSSYPYANRHYYNFKFTELTQGKEYTYKCGEETNIFKFPKGNKIVTFGDWSVTDDALITVNYLKTKDYNAMLNLGDLAYDLHYKNGEVGNTFMEFIKPVTTNMPFMLIAGNHEANDDYNDYFTRFTLPMKSQNKNLYYSFNIGDAHFIAINSEFGISKKRKYNEMRDQFKGWYNNDMQIYRDIKWKIVFMHRPLYCSLTRLEVCTKDTDELRDFFEEMFTDIDLVIAGHVHNYERTLPVYKHIINEQAVDNNGYYINPRAPAYIVCGSAGNIHGMSEVCNYYLLR